MAHRLVRNILMVATALTAVGCQSGRVSTAMSPTPKAGAGVAMLQARMEAAARRQVRFDAVEAAEAAVRLAADDLEARKSLARAYFGAGRFRSAAQTYGDALAMSPGDDSLRFRKALALLAQGHQAAALAELDRVRDTRNVGLAYALAGRPDRGVELLMQEARQPDATAQTRQNLALAFALAGQWAQARTVAAQDLDPAGVETRIRQWAEFAASADPVVQTASLLRVSPLTSDEGRPIGLAYVPPAERFIQHAQAAPATPVETIEVAANTAASKAETKNGAIGQLLPDKFATKTAAAATGRWVVQLGAYDRPDLLEANWRRIVQRSAGLLGDYDAVRSEVTIGDRRLHRLAVAGFDSRTAAVSLCQTLQAKGRECFVRNLSAAAVHLANVEAPSRA